MTAETSNTDIVVKDVTMQFRRAKDEATSLKELLIRSLRRERRYELFTALDNISFTVEKDKMDATIELMQSYVETIGASSVVFDDDVAKVSIVGAGMESHPGVASDMFEALFEANVNIQMISTSEIKISVLIKKEDANKAVAAIHAKFFEQIGQ